MAGITGICLNTDPNRNASFDDTLCRPAKTIPAASDARSGRISLAGEGPVPFRDAEKNCRPEGSWTLDAHHSEWPAPFGSMRLDVIHGGN